MARARCLIPRNPLRAIEPLSLAQQRRLIRENVYGYNICFAYLGCGRVYRKTWSEFSNCRTGKPRESHFFAVKVQDYLGNSAISIVLAQRSVFVTRVSINSAIANGAPCAVQHAMVEAMRRYKQARESGTLHWIRL